MDHMGFEKAKNLILLYEKQSAFESSVCLLLQVVLQIFDSGRHLVKSLSNLSYLFFKESKILSRHLCAQIFHSSLNLSEESIHVFVKPEAEAVEDIDILFTQGE